MVWRIKDWDKIYENSKSRSLRKLDFVLVPNRHDGYGFRALMSQPDGTALLGAWLLILQVASKADPRGYLIIQGGQPHTPRSIALKTGGSEAVIERALHVLSSTEVGWIEQVEDPADFLVKDTDDTTPEERIRSHVRMDRILQKGGVTTPLGQVLSRPSTCQWCNRAPDMAGGGMPNVISHHLTAPDNHANVRCIIFLCRSCKASFESGKYNTRMVLEKFGADWLPRIPEPKNLAPDAHATTGQAPDGTCLARARRTEQNRTEGKGSEQTGAHLTELPASTPAAPLPAEPGLFVFPDSNQIQNPGTDGADSFRSFPETPRIAPAERTPEGDKIRAGRLKQALRKFMAAQPSGVGPPVADYPDPPQTVVTACLNACSNANMNTVETYLVDVWKRGQRRGTSNGPRDYPWFITVLRARFQPEATDAPADEPAPEASLNGVVR